MALTMVRAVSPPMTVPLAAENASPNKANIQMSNSGTSGKRRNKRAATTVENTHGHIRRGAGRLSIAAPNRITKATIALNGKIRIAEKSTRQATVSPIRFPPNVGRSALVP